MEENKQAKPSEEIFSAFKFEHFQEPGEEFNKKLVTDLSDLDDSEIEKQVEAAKEKAANLKKPKVETPEDASTEELEDEVSTEEVIVDEPADEDGDEPEVSFKPLVEALSEKGILVYNSEDEFEDTDEGLESVIVKTIQSGIEEYKASLPEELHELANFIDLGGNINDYLQAKSNVATLENIDITKEDVQEKVLRAYLKTQEYTEDEIEDAINDYTDSLMLEKEAKRALNKLTKIAEKEEAELLQRQQALEAEQKKQYEDYITNLKSTIMKSENIAGLKVSERDRKAFSDYLTKPDRNGKTEYAKDLEKDYMNNSIALAYFKFKNFNFEDIEKKVEKKITKDIKSKMFNKTTKTIKSSTRTPHEGADKEQFQAFRGIWEQ